MPQILKTGEKISEAEVLEQAAQILAAGGIIAYPTETFYGLGADAANEEAIRKIFAIKGRNFHNPISVIISDEKNLNPLVRGVSDNAKKLMTAFWPGALTLVFAAADRVSLLLTADSGKIGIRLSGHQAAREIAARLSHPVTATSANLSGAPECSTAAEVAAQIGYEIDAIVDWGETPGGRGSTIIDTTSTPPAVIREGAISRSLIEQNTGIIFK